MCDLPVHKRGRLFEDAAGNKYNVRNSVDCKSSNVVYAMLCERCRKYVYVGEKGDTLYQRHLMNLSRNRTRTLTRWLRTFTLTDTAWQTSA